MGSDNRFDALDGYALNLIKYKARQLVGRAGFTPSDRDDLEQEMLLDLIQRMPKYDPDRAGARTFIARMVAHKIADIILARKAGMRDFRICFCSLDDHLEDEEGGLIALEEYLVRTGKLARPVSERHDLFIDIHKVMARLPPKLRELCRRLKTETVAEIARETGVSRAVIYESIKKLRAIFEEAGLRDYL